ncbi:hypothetical protein [Paenibacillus athensensis]
MMGDLVYGQSAIWMALPGCWQKQEAGGEFFCEKRFHHQASLFVEEEYSAECRAMFGRDIAFARIDELLGGSSRDDRAYITEVLASLFASCPAGASDCPLCGGPSSNTAARLRWTARPGAARPLRFVCRCANRAGSRDKADEQAHAGGWFERAISVQEAVHSRR